DRPAAAHDRAAARLEPVTAGRRLVALDAGELRAAGSVAVVVGLGPVLRAAHAVADVHRLVGSNARGGPGESHRVRAAAVRGRGTRGARGWPGGLLIPGSPAPARPRAIASCSQDTVTSQSRL